MVRPVRLVTMSAVLMFGMMFAVGNSQSQEKKETPKVKGQLPAGWKALDLTAAQKEAVYKIQSEYREKIEKLEDEIKKLKGEQTKKVNDVLTPEQKKKLIDAIEGTKKEEPKKKKEEAKKE